MENGTYRKEGHRSRARGEVKTNFLNKINILKDTTPLAIHWKKLSLKYETLSAIHELHVASNFSLSILGEKGGEKTGSYSLLLSPTCIVAEAPV